MKAKTPMRTPPPDTEAGRRTRPADFSPDHMHMYVCFQKNGVVLDITRIDGKSVGGRSIDVKFHNLFGGVSE